MVFFFFGSLQLDFGSFVVALLLRVKGEGQLWVFLCVPIGLLCRSVGCFPCGSYILKRKSSSFMAGVSFWDFHSCIVWRGKARFMKWSFPFLFRPLGCVWWSESRARCWRKLLGRVAELGSCSCSTTFAVGVFFELRSCRSFV